MYRILSRAVVLILFTVLPLYAVAGHNYSIVTSDSTGYGQGNYPEVDCDLMKQSVLDNFKKVGRKPEDLSVWTCSGIDATLQDIYKHEANPRTFQITHNASGMTKTYSASVRATGSCTAGKDAGQMEIPSEYRDLSGNTIQKFRDLESLTGVVSGCKVSGEGR